MLFFDVRLRINIHVHMYGKNGQTSPCEETAVNAGIDTFFTVKISIL